MAKKKTGKEQTQSISDRLAGMLPKAIALPTLATCKPRGDRVVIKLDPTQKASPGGILLAGGGMEDRRPAVGTVISVGPGRNGDAGNTIPVDLRPGDRVVYLKFAGTTVDAGGPDDKDYILLREEDVVAVL